MRIHLSTLANVMRSHSPVQETYNRFGDAVKLNNYTDALSVGRGRTALSGHESDGNFHLFLLYSFVFDCEDAMPVKREVFTVQEQEQHCACVRAVSEHSRCSRW